MKYSQELVKWYQKNKRDLPFRRSRDAYSIWVSEIMAQQTRIDTMIPYYETWIGKWPTIEALASANIDDVLFVWQGLGYYNRARKLHEGAKFICEHHQGEFPKTVNDLLKVPGIGPYTAGAIGSIAYDLKAPAVDGNVLRVITRNHEMQDDIMKKKTCEKISEIVYNYMEDCKPSVFTQALMELGALVCTPKSPKCNICPLTSLCKAYQNQSAENYPVKKRAKKAVPIELHTYIIINEKYEICISNDDGDGLMKGLLRLPQYTEMPQELEGAELVETRKHVFSHRIWNMKCYVLQVEDFQLDNTWWMKIDELKNISMVTAHRKWLEEIIEGEKLCEFKNYKN